MKQGNAGTVIPDPVDRSHDRVEFDLSDHSRPLCEAIAKAVGLMGDIKKAKLKRNGKLVYQPHPTLKHSTPDELKEAVDSLIRSRIKVSPKAAPPRETSRRPSTKNKGYVNRTPVLTT